MASYSIIPLRIGLSGQRVVEEGEVGAVDPGKGGGGAKETRGKWKVCFRLKRRGLKIFPELFN